jgi:hypothetical protein
MARWSSIDVRGALTVRLAPALSSSESVVGRLNEATTDVVAIMDRDTLVIRPKSQLLVAGMPVYYGRRPEFSGQVVRDDSGSLILAGAIKQSDLPAMVNIVGALFAAFIAMVGAATLLAGDSAGIVSLAFAALAGLAVLASHLMIRRLSGIDEQTIQAALRAISAER